MTMGLRFATLRFRQPCSTPFKYATSIEIGSVDRMTAGRVFPQAMWRAVCGCRYDRENTGFERVEAARR
jgi:hypothetical protein